MQFVVGLGDKVAPTDIEEGMRVGYACYCSVLQIIKTTRLESAFFWHSMQVIQCFPHRCEVPVCRVDRTKYQIQVPLPPKIDPSVTMMTVEEKPDVTYSDIGGCKEQIERMREVVELPMLHPEKFVQLGIDPPKGVLCYGPPGTGKTLLVCTELACYCGTSPVIVIADERCRV